MSSRARVPTLWLSREISVATRDAPLAKSDCSRKRLREGVIFWWCEKDSLEGEGRERIGEGGGGGGIWDGDGMQTDGKGWNWL